MKQHLPNSITLFNLFCGCAALVHILFGEFIAAFWFLFAAGLADYADGFVARLLKVDSPMGKELDSLADMVSFGVVPGAIFYKLLSVAWAADYEQAVLYPALIGFLVSVFSGLRLAKFNLDTRQTEGFIGLNTPSCTMFTVGLMLIFKYDTFGLSSLVTNPIFLVVAIVCLSYLLIAELPMFSFKFKHFRWQGNEARFSFLAITVLSLIFLREAAFSFVVILYVFFAIMNQLLLKRKA